LGELSLDRRGTPRANGQRILGSCDEWFQGYLSRRRFRIPHATHGYYRPSVRRKHGEGAIAADALLVAGVLVPLDIELIEDAIAGTPQLLRNRREELIDDRRIAEAIYRVALASGLMEKVAYQDTTAESE
jgi:hypothetical protein